MRFCHNFVFWLNISLLTTRTCYYGVVEAFQAIILIFHMWPDLVKKSQNWIKFVREIAKMRFCDNFVFRWRISLFATRTCYYGVMEAFQAIISKYHMWPDLMKKSQNLIKSARKIAKMRFCHNFVFWLNISLLTTGTCFYGVVEVFQAKYIFCDFSRRRDQVFHTLRKITQNRSLAHMKVILVYVIYDFKLSSLVRKAYLYQQPMAY